MTIAPVTDGGTTAVAAGIAASVGEAASAAFPLASLELATLLKESGRAPASTPGLDSLLGIGAGGVANASSRDALTATSFSLHARAKRATAVAARTGYSV